MTDRFYPSQRFGAQFQRKKNQFLFLPLPVRKWGFCSRGSLADLMGAAGNGYLGLLCRSIDLKEGGPTLAPRFS
jgi:hypothetical protein